MASKYGRNSQSFSWGQTHGGRGCGGCHNMGVKSEAQKEAQLKLGYRYQNNSCDERHMPKDTHDNHTVWGFLRVRLPLEM